MTLLVYHRVIVDHSTQVESYLDKCIEWFQKALKHFAKQDAIAVANGTCGKAMGTCRILLRKIEIYPLVN